MFASAIFLKPDGSAAGVYLRVGSAGAVNSPAASVTTVRVRPVPSCLSVTVAPGITPPVASVIVPRMVPVTDWAVSERANRLTAMTRPISGPYPLRRYSLQRAVARDLGRRHTSAAGAR